MFPSLHLLLLLAWVFGLHELGHFTCRRWSLSKQATAAKEALTALMGPLPGIVLALILMIAGLHGAPASWMEAAYVLALFNGLNLLPFYPLDGGRFFAALGCIRTPSAEIVFRTVAMSGLAALAWWTNETWLLVFALMPLAGFRRALLATRAANRLEADGWTRPSVDASRMSETTRLEIRAALARIAPTLSAPRVIERLSLEVFSKLNRRRPPVMATITLSLAYAFGLLGALVVSRLPGWLA